MIVPIWRNHWCLSTGKKSTSFFMFSLRYCKDIAIRSFWVPWVILATLTQSDTINLLGFLMRTLLTRKQPKLNWTHVMTKQYLKYDFLYSWVNSRIVELPYFKQQAVIFSLCVGICSNTFKEEDKGIDSRPNLTGQLRICYKTNERKGFLMQSWLSNVCKNY